MEKALTVGTAKLVRLYGRAQWFVKGEMKRRREQRGAVSRNVWEQAHWESLLS